MCVLKVFSLVDYSMNLVHIDLPGKRWFPKWGAGPRREHKAIALYVLWTGAAESLALVTL